MAVQLLRVAESPSFGKAIAIPWQKAIETRMTLTEYVSMEKTKYTNVPSQTWRGKIIIKERLVRRKTQGVQKTILSMINFG